VVLINVLSTLIYSLSLAKIILVTTRSPDADSNGGRDSMGQVFLATLGREWPALCLFVYALFIFISVVSLLAYHLSLLHAGETTNERV
jgi:hypothetical protein